MQSFIKICLRGDLNAIFYQNMPLNAICYQNMPLNAIFYQNMPILHNQYKSVERCIKLLYLQE
jgi:hypothetical protein